MPESDFLTAGSAANACCELKDKLITAADKKAIHVVLFKFIFVFLR
jgi:hypothetical protein